MKGLPGVGRLLVAGCALWLAGCVTPRLHEGVAPGPQEQQSRLLALTRWEARGRVAMRPIGDQAAQKGGQGNLRWQQAGDAAHIRLSGPFGSGAYQIDWDPRRLTITSRTGEVAVDDTGPLAAEAFLNRQLGWSLPVGSTRYWLLGVADPAAPANVVPDDLGRLAALNQGGWEIRYEEYTRVDDLWLPRKLVMTSEHARVRLVIDAWQF